MTEQPHLRVSDAERDDVLHQLAHHASEGRLTLAELELRSAQALRSTTRGDLAAATHDLEPGDVLVFYTDGVVEARRRKAQFGG